MTAADRFFVDTNLVLCFVDPVDSRKRSRAAEWLDALWAAGAGCLSWQVLNEFYQNAVRKMGLEPAAARELVEDLALWRPVETSIGLMRQAWFWMDSARLPYWDALIVAAAERSGARYILSEDFQAGRRFAGIEVVNPFERGASGFRL
jgi:predicted nucleic acid-binding protein